MHTTIAATFPAYIGNTAGYALIDTGATKSCINESF